MKRIAFLATMTFLLLSTAALGENLCPDRCSDGDGVIDALDNCSERYNAAQDDTDGDDCGNLCDADYDQSGAVDFADFGIFASCFGLTGCAEQQHVEPISNARTVDFVFFASAFGAGPPGPSGTTIGTTACPWLANPADSLCGVAKPRSGVPLLVGESCEFALRRRKTPFRGSAPGRRILRIRFAASQNPVPGFRSWPAMGLKSGWESGDPSAREQRQRENGGSQSVERLSANPASESGQRQIEEAWTLGTPRPVSRESIRRLRSFSGRATNPITLR